MTDREYQNRRNLLIPEAERVANEVCCSTPGKGSPIKEKEEWAMVWTRLFMETMTRLWREERGKHVEEKGRYVEVTQGRRLEV